MKGSRGSKFFNLSKTDLAEACGVSLNTVYGWIRQGCPKNSDGTFNLTEVLQWREKKGSSKVGSLERERARLAREQADKLAMENAKARGELVPASLLSKSAERVFVAFRSRMEALPRRAIPLLRGAATDGERETILRDLVREALFELSRFDFSGIAQSDRDGMADGSGDAETGSESNRKPVGRRTPHSVARGKRRTRKVEN